MVVAEGPGVAPATASIAATGRPVPPVATGPIAGDAEAGRWALTSCCTAARTASRIAGSIPTAEPVDGAGGTDTAADGGLPDADGGGPSVAIA